MFHFKKNDIALLILLLLAVFPFIALSFFNHPSADDLIFSHVARSSGVIANVYNYYFEWSGRFFFSFLIAINPLAFNWEFGYKIIPVLIIISTYSGLFLFVKLFVKNHFVNIYIETLLLLVLAIQLFPSPVEALYWMSASTTYTLPFLLLFALVYLMLKQNKGLGVYILAGIISFLLCGSNELAMVLAFALFLLLLIFNSLEKRKDYKIAIPVLFLLAGIAISTLAPGNIRRLEFFPLHGQIMQSIINSVFSFSRISVHLLTEPALLVFLFIVFVFGAQQRFKISEIFLSKRRIFIVPVVSVLLTITLYFPGYFAMGIAPPPRIHNFVSFVMFLILVINAAIFGTYFGKFKALNFTNDKGILLNVLLIIVVIIMFTGFKKRPGNEIVFSSNVANAWYDLIVEAPLYEKEMTDRTAQVEKAHVNKIDSILLKPIIHKPYTIFYLDITTNPDHWLNISFKEYYQIKTVKLQN